ncbi:hypothetical protein Tco_0578633 [Tanacetum coccineum]
MVETIEQYMTKTQDDYGSRIARTKFDDKVKFELKGQFLKELRKNTFSGSDNEDANEHIERVLEIADLFTVPGVTQDQLMLRNFPISLTRAARKLRRLMKKFMRLKWDVNCAKGPHYTKGCPSKEEGKTLKEAYYTQFGAPYPQGGRYRAAASGFYQRDGGNPSYQERRQTMEETLSKFMVESTKRHDENTNLIKEIQASTNAAIKNQGASIKALEIQIGQISKVLQEKGSGGLPSSTETNPRDYVNH